MMPYPSTYDELASWEMEAKAYESAWWEANGQ